MATLDYPQDDTNAPEDEPRTWYALWTCRPPTTKIPASPT